MKKIKPVGVIAIALLLSLTVPDHLAAQGKTVSAFPLNEVRLLPGIFKNAETADLKYILALDADRLLAPFVREAGLPSKAESYPNWENTGLDGHIGGHYLTALSLMYASTGNAKLKERLLYMLDVLQKCQDAGNGYIGGVPQSKQLWQDIAAGTIQAESFGLNKRWVPLYNIHKLYAGLRDAYLIAGVEKAKGMFIRYTDWMLKEVSSLTDAQIQTMLRSEHGGLNEVFADAYAITGKKEYLELAQKFSHQTILNPLKERRDIFTGMHANTQIPKVIGFKRIADLGGDSSYNGAAKFFWENVVYKRSSVIGGNSVREHFNPVNDFSSMINDVQGPETCNSYNMLKLTKQFYLSEANLRYIDYYERTLYNHILSTENPVKGGFVYFTPMRPGHYRVYSQPETSFWCCVGSGLENHAKYGELIYAHTANELYVNLFIPSTVNWKQKAVSIKQETTFPDEDKATITIDAKKPTRFVLQLRYPSWAKSGSMKVKVNGQEQKVDAMPGNYVRVERKWKKGDKVIVHVPMQNTSERLPDQSKYVALLHGPIVLAAATDTSDMTGLYADASRGGHIASGKLLPLENMPLLVSESNNIESQMKQVPGKNLRFTLSEVLYPSKFKNIELVPFYSLHDTRYIIYWQKLNAGELKANEEKLKAQKIEEEKLAARTIDMVYPGEQQPESDHFIQSNQSSTGVNRGRHWRDTRDFFSYQMNDRENKAAVLRVTYFGPDRGRKFSISVNETKIADVVLDGSKGDNFYFIDYDIPQQVLDNAKGKALVVKFSASEKSVAGGVYEVRLLKKE